MKRKPVYPICLLALTLNFVAGTLAGADETRQLLNPPIWADRDDKEIPEPADREISELYDVLRNTWFRHWDFGYTALRMSNRPALNVNAWDEVPDSSWFTNRLSRRPMTRQEFVEGAPGVAPSPGKFSVRTLKTAGYTPGLQIRDAAGQNFMLKFDLPSAPERNSAADRIGSLLMHAAGYNVPHNTIVYFTPEDLIIDDEAVYEDLVGRERPMTETDLEEALSMLAPGADGSYRGLASHFIPGVPKGYFPYWGTRKDDPNDLIPHELRREIRGFQVIASWFNHVDVKEVNTFETYVTEDGRRFLKHYFIDFGSTIGSGNFQNGPLRVGHEHIYDANSVGKSLVTFGGWQRPWDATCRVIYPEVGHFEALLFDPAKWKPNYPNLAFLEMDDADGYWGAKIVTSFDDDLVRALAEEGSYSRSEVTEYIDMTFRSRRDAIGRYWFERVTALEDFELQVDPREWTMRFRDLAWDRGYAGEEGRTYDFVLKGAYDWTEIGRGRSTDMGEIRFEPVGDLQLAPSNRFGRAPLFVLEIQSLRQDGSPALPVHVIVGYQEGERTARVLGWAHASRR